MMHCYLSGIMGNVETRLFYAVVVLYLIELTLQLELEGCD